jgi:predicted small metal-binding protein
VDVPRDRAGGFEPAIVKGQRRRGGIDEIVLSLTTRGLTMGRGPRISPRCMARAWRLAMALRIICMCGYVIRGDDDEELWRNAQSHMGILHPELVDNVSREDILAQAERL